MTRDGGGQGCVPLVIGLGNPDRGDDGVGRVVARLLRDQVPPHVPVEQQSGAAADLVERLRDVDSVVLIDAVVTGAPAGTIRTIDCIQDAAALRVRQSASSHGLGVPEAILLARLLHGSPSACMLYGIEGAVFVPGAVLSPAVAAAAEQLVARLAAKLRAAVRQ